MYYQNNLGDKKCLVLIGKVLLKSLRNHCKYIMESWYKEPLQNVVFMF